MGRRFSGKYAAGRRGGDVHSPGTVAEMRNFERMHGSAGKPCNHKNISSEKRRVGVAFKIPTRCSFRMCVFLPQTVSETRNFKRTRRPAGTSCNHKNISSEKRRVGVAVVTFRRNVHFACTSFFRKPVLKRETSRERAVLLARHAVARTAAEKRRNGVAVMRFLRNVHFTCASFFRKPFLKWDFERTRRPAGTPLQLQEQWQWEAARRRFGHDFSIPFISRSPFSIKPLSKRKSA